MQKTKPESKLYQLQKDTNTIVAIKIQQNQNFLNGTEQVNHVRYAVKISLCSRQQLPQTGLRLIN